MFEAKEKAEGVPRSDSLSVLLEQIRTGSDADAFEKLCGMYANLLDAAVRQFAPSMGISADGTSDLLGIGREELHQDAAVALYRAACSYVPDEAGKGQDVSFGLYAKICIRNAMISQVRKYVRKKKRASSRKHEMQTAADTAGELLLAEEIIRSIQAELSPYEKKILPMYLEGKPPREIAGVVGRTEKSVSNGIYRIKSKIRKWLESQ
ncbi:MAG: sigma-70 family RNA polymerase sigma factor [Clostridia bacterium]|nr:sigma-70 family RNA polymerase sigma factor [Clostridia bacterium]